MLQPLNDDWYEWVDESHHSVRVKLGQADDGRLHVSAIQIEGNDLPISALTLRGVPVGRIEAHANAHLLPDQLPVEPQPMDATITPELFTLEDRSRPDDFYAEVAAIYRNLVSHTKQPVVHIALANNVPKSTAHRWVKEARNRGHLPPGRPGKAG
jgi:hypothetical protein